MLPEKAPPAPSAALQDGGPRCPLTPALSRKGRGCQCHAVAEVSLSMVQEPMSVDVKQAIQELIVPDLREIKSDVKGLQSEIKRLDEKIDAQGARLDDKISSLRNEMLSEFRRLDEKVDLTMHVRERLVSMETRMAAYENRN